VITIIHDILLMIFIDKECRSDTSNIVEYYRTAFIYNCTVKYKNRIHMHKNEND